MTACKLTLISCRYGTGRAEPDAVAAGSREAAFIAKIRNLDVAVQADIERMLNLPDADRSAVLRLLERAMDSAGR